MAKNAFHQTAGDKHKGRKYCRDQIARMEDLRYRQRKSLADIALEFKTDKADIERTITNHALYTDGKPLKATFFDGWDFRGMDVA